jgi:hypothetical protein
MLSSIQNADQEKILMDIRHILRRVASEVRFSSFDYHKCEGLRRSTKPSSGKSGATESSYNIRRLAHELPN